MKRLRCALAIAVVCGLVPFVVTAAPPVQLVITGAEADLDGGTVTIVGMNFGDDVPSVTLGGIELVVQTSTSESIVAELPAGLAVGSYLLTVSRGPATTQTSDFELTIGEVDDDGGIPPTATVTVSCPTETIGAALETPAIELTIEFTGTCVEDVVIARDRTTLRGTGADTVQGSVTVEGASNVTLEDFSVVNGRGVRVSNGSSANITRVSSTDSSATFGLGFVAAFSSNAVLTDVTARDNFFAGIASINSSHVRILGSVTVEQSTNTGIFVGGSSDLDSRASSLSSSDNGFSGLTVQSGGSAFLSTIDTSNNFVGINLVNGGVAAINGGTQTANIYGVYLDTGSTAEVRNLIVDGGGVTATGNSTLRASDVTVTGDPNPDFSVGVVIQSSHLLTFGGSIDNSVYLAEASDANFAAAPTINPGGLSCHPTAVAYGALSCPP